MAGLSKWAKYGVLAMVVADAAGILIVHNRLNRPAVDVPSISEEVPIAMTDMASALPKDAAQVTGSQVTGSQITGAVPMAALPKDDYQVTGGLAQNDLQALPAMSRMDPLPAPMKIEPLALEVPQATAKVAREMQKALRAPVIPTVRIAQLHSARKATRTFSSAFSNDISVSTSVSGLEPDVDFARVRAARNSVQSSGSVDVETRLDPLSPVSPTENLVASVQTQSSVPVPAFGGNIEPQQLQLDLPAAPVAPEANTPSTGEIPAS